MTQDDSQAAAPASVPATLARAVWRGTTPVRRAISPQTWTAITSAATFVGLAAALALVPIDFVAWSPGTTVDLLATNDGKPVIQVSGLPTHPVSGQLRMTTVSVTRVDSRLSLPQAWAAYWLPHRDVLPREVVYKKGLNAEEVRQTEVAMMDDAKANAMVAALRAAHQKVVELPQVDSVVISGPAYQKLQPGDLVQKVDQTDVQTKDDVSRIIRKHKVGDPVVFTVQRDGKPTDVTVTTIASNDDKTVPVVGIGLRLGYQYSPSVSYGIDPAIVGPSAGLVFSLAIYDQITPGDLVGGRSVAGTGGIDPTGRVTPIGGIQEKVAGAESAGAKVFLVPAGNCADLAGVHSSMSLVKVTNVSDAITSLEALKSDNGGQEVPRC